MSDLAPGGSCRHRRARSRPATATRVPPGCRGAAAPAPAPPSVLLPPRASVIARCQTRQARVRSLRRQHQGHARQRRNDRPRSVQWLGIRHVVGDQGDRRNPARSPALRLPAGRRRNCRRRRTGWCWARANRWPPTNSRTARCAPSCGTASAIPRAASVASTAQDFVHRVAVAAGSGEHHRHRRRGRARRAPALRRRRRWPARPSLRHAAARPAAAERSAAAQTAPVRMAPRPPIPAAPPASLPARGRATPTPSTNTRIIAAVPGPGCNCCRRSRTNCSARVSTRAGSVSR